MDGYQIALIVVAILLLLASGHIRLLTKELKELMDVIHIALEDKKVTRAELKSIVKEAADVKDVILKISQLLAWKKR